MPEQQQIPVPQVVGAPSVYTLGPNVELILEAVTAEFRDNGAAADWLPTVELVSDSGHLIARAADQGVKVTAGDDADVSFFPWLAQAQTASSGGGAAWFFAKRETAFTVTTTTPTRRVPFTHIVTSDATVFTTSVGAGGDITVTGNQLGIYLGLAQVGWHSPATYPNSCLIVTDFFGVSVAASSPLSASTSAADPVGEVTNIHDAMLAVTQSVPGEISLTVKNWDGVNHNVDSAYYMIAYWPNTTPVS